MRRGGGGIAKEGARLFKIEDFKALIACVKINELLLRMLLSDFTRGVFFFCFLFLFFFSNVWLKSIPVQSSALNPKARTPIMVPWDAFAKDAVTRLKSKAPAGAPRAVWQHKPKVSSLSKLSLAKGSSEINMLIHKLSSVIITTGNSNYKRH